jgi:hypothetical protein
MGVDRLIVVKLDSNPPTREQLSTVVGSIGQMINFVFAQNEDRSLGGRPRAGHPECGPNSATSAPATSTAGRRRSQPASRRRARVADQLADSAEPEEYAAWRTSLEDRRRPVDHIDEVRVVGLSRVSPDLFAPVVERIKASRWTARRSRTT